MPRASNRPRQRASRACDFCHARGLRCRRPTSESGTTLPGCLTCVDYGVKCTQDRPAGKRGRKPKSLIVEVLSDVSSPQPVDHFSLQTVRRLTRIYRDTMYQCYFPFLPEKDLSTRWEDSIPSPEEPSYIVLMALCAVSAHTAELEAVFDDSLLEGSPLPDSHIYFEEAVSRLSPSFPQDFDYLRVFGLLTVYALQCGDNRNLHHYLGRYHALVAEYGFHDESRWPSNISLAEVDDRRRLFWCAYRLEIHSACVFGHIIRMPEAQVSVFYPRTTPMMDAETQTWTVGWDYITDLFRLLEYAMFGLRACKTRKAILAIFCDRPSLTMLLDSLARLKSSKSHTLNDLKHPERGFNSKRCNYMAVQISCTETLVTIMALLYCQAPAREVMEVAESFLQELTAAPLIMFKVAGSQIVHQLLGVGHMLSNASQYDNGQYRSEARRLIIFLADLVKNLKDVIPAAAAAGDRLLILAQATS
ncbi:hypothetical protein BDZ85DRAFT_32223 [Elsinoe ampelina]|uniref:Zn(2)-C6 fungal-type domain-containing protein n=1 Tax=Elsinoe ampelina TaxID=302913 RepID=A0A6A6G3J0_9PEZI|nr:hypothetical protein BDZ85DRAFT_32223 [Elsinoe ampelina]